MTTMELIERGIGHNCLSDAYDLGRTDAFNEILNEMRKSPFASDKATFVKKYIEEQLKENDNE